LRETAGASGRGSQPQSGEALGHRPRPLRAAALNGWNGEPRCAGRNACVSKSRCSKGAEGTSQEVRRVSEARSWSLVERTPKQSAARRQVPRKRDHHEDRCVSQRSLPSNFLLRGCAGCIGVRARRQINALFENRIRTSELWSQETRTMRLPRLSPLRRPISAFGVFSMPSSTSSCTFSLPDATQPCSSATAFIA
jgi:hypothetical protein